MNADKNIIHGLTSDHFYKEVKLLLGQTDREKTVTLISIDFDNFNYVNDIFGYEIGDQTLTRIFRHFDLQLNDSDIFSRIHADHFLFCIQCDKESEINDLCRRLTDFSSTLFDLLPEHYTLVASGGILIVKPNNNLPLSALLDKANYARKQAKGNVNSTLHYYDETLEKEVQWQKQITYMMQAALKNHEFEMYLQPKLLIKTGEVVGAEALVRWNSPTLGLIYPDRFISIMERNGFVRQLDFFMLEEACRFLNASKMNSIAQLPISVNFSKAHLQTDHLVDKIYQTVDRMGIPAKLIEIEFTESLFSSNIKKLIEIVKDLKRRGFHVSMDDFGSAYSSLNYLKDLPIDIVKIDKGFLDSAANTEKGKVIITKVVEMIKSLHMLSVMEGIESSDQLEFLQDLSCDLGQGYYFAKPMPSNDFITYLQKGLLHFDKIDETTK